MIYAAVGAVPVMIASAFYDSLTIGSLVLAVCIGMATAVNSLWEDLSDYASDLKSNAIARFCWY